MDDEESLVKAVVEYKAQLASISDLIPIEGDQTRLGELVNLREDLMELVEATEGQLLNLKKSRLVSSFADADIEILEDESQPSTSNTSPSFNEDDLIGMSCWAPYKTRRLSLHTAVIMEVLEPGLQNSFHVKVLFSHPIQESMVACRQFLSGKCTFGHNCKFSHGELVRFEDLREYSEPDFESLVENDKCLARCSDDDPLWYIVKIASICREEKRVAACFLDTGNISAVAFENIVPLSFNIEENSDMEEVDGLETSPNLHGSHSGQRAHQKSKEQSSNEFGSWEQHTKGIGSKLMAKMGYVSGDGLGKSSSGMLNPIPIKKYRKGMSLDHCLNIGKNDEDKTTKIPKEKRIKKDIAKVDPVFDFLNTKIMKSGTKEHRKKKSKTDATKSSTNHQKNQQIFKLDEKKKAKIREISQLKQSLARNEAKDSHAASKIRIKMEGAVKHLTRIEEKRNKVASKPEKWQDQKMKKIF